MTEHAAATSDGNALLALVLGIGGGLVLAYVRRRSAGHPDAVPLADRSPPRPTAPTKPELADGAGGGACSLTLDAGGLTVDGHSVDVAGAVARCKAAGSAQILLGKDGPASVYIDLCRALAGAGVLVTVSRETEP